MFEDNQ